MMKDFEILQNDIELNNIIDTINEIHKNTLLACHGRYHTMNVVDVIRKILTELNYTNRIVELGMIAGILHDIGIIEGKNGHAIRSAEYAKKFLVKTYLTDSEKEIVCHSIEDHSNGIKINSPIGAALLIADKIDLSKNRVTELGKKDKWHSNLLEIEKSEIIIKNQTIIINYCVTPKFSLAILKEEWKKGILLPIKASEYLDCKCIFQINHQVVDLSL